jgi:hypothetical protein
MKIIQDIRREMARRLVGEQFAYKTPYGGVTFGEIKDVGVEHVMGFDQVTSGRVSRMLSKGSQGMEEQPKSAEPDENYTRWVGIKPRFYVISTNNISYMLNEIYILSVHEEVTVA